MTIIKEKLSDFKEKFEEAQKLIEDTKLDSLEPYKNCYKAREILIQLEKVLLKNIEEENDDNLITLHAILGNVQKDIGKISMFVDETNQAESYLNKSLDLLEPNSTDPKIIICYADILNQLGLLWSKLQDMDKSKKFLEKSEESVKNFKELATSSPLTIFDVFGTSDEIEKGKGDENLEKICTFTFFYLAQVYGTLNELEKSAKYCHLTLKRQLELKDYEAIDWALNSATLSQYYFSKNMLKQSRHLLAASYYMLENYSEDLEKKVLTEDEREAALENLRHRTADIDLCFAKYCIYIIKTSIERLLLEDEESAENSTLESVQYQVNDNCDSFAIDLEMYERQVTDQFVLTFEDAKCVFLSAQSYLSKAKEYYSLENEASQYARITQDYANLYKHLAFFEDDSATQAKLHKRRADQLEAVLGELNPTYYLNICR
jgi:KIF-binding protein